MSAEIRPGRAMFNALLQINPDLAEELRGSDVDPFHDDDRIPAFLAAVNAAAESTPEIPDSLKEALKWAEIVTGGLQGSQCPEGYDRDLWEWIARLVNERLQLVLDVAAGRKVACRFAGNIDSDGRFIVYGEDQLDDSEMDAEALFNSTRPQIHSRGTVYLAVPAAEEVEGETDE